MDTFALLGWSHMFLHGTWQPMDSFMCSIPEHEANSAAYHLFISIYCKRFDQLFFFSVNFDLDFLKEYCLLFPLSSLRHSMYHAIYVVAPWAGCLQISMSFHLPASFLKPCVQDRSFCLLSDSTGREGDCYGS